MPGQIRAVPGTNTIYATFQARIFNEDSTTLHRPHWAYELRGPATKGTEHFTTVRGRWPSRSGFCGDPAAPASLQFDRDYGTGNGSFEPWQYGFGGQMGINFIIGQCKDADGNGVSGATVQGFRTSDDAFVGETTADSSGFYMLGTPNLTATAHYLVAYRTGSPDIAGTTVNTLLPTNAAGL